MTDDPLEEVKAALPTDYGVDTYIKKGGQGAVFRGTFRDSPAAIKLFEPDADEERIRREIDALQALSCEHLVKVLGHDDVELRDQHLKLVAYELVDGSDLTTVLGRKPLPEQTFVIDVGASVGAAIEALWSKRIVHRDVKPANIVAGTDGRIVLVDVGIAQHLDLKTITGLGGQPGTPGYRSPEQCGGRRRLTVHSDVFSLGLTLYELASGVHPWGRRQALIGHTPLPSLLDKRADLDSRLVSAIQRMLRQRPAERPNNPGHLFADLRTQVCST